MLLALTSPALGGLLLNEVVYRTSGDDVEWIELCNSGPDAIDLSGYTIEGATSSWSVVYDEDLSGTVDPGGYFIIGSGSPSFDAAFSPALGNAGSSTDGIRIVDPSGVTVDTLLYGTPNDSGLADDQGNTTLLATVSGDDESLGRWPDCADTDDASVDFTVYATPSPGVANTAPTTGGGDTGDTGTPSTAQCAEGVVINEFASATDEEFVELYNAGAEAVSLDGWALEWGTSSFSYDYTFGAVVLEPAGFYVVAREGASYADAEADLESFGNATSNADAIRLSCGGAAVDTVIYAGDGSENTDGWTDDLGNTAESLAIRPDDGESAARIADGWDTDACGDDFAIAEPTPGEPNPVPPPPPDCTAVDVVINEFMVATGYEYVELYNAGASTAEIGGWELQFGTSSFGDAVAIDDGVSLAPGMWWVVGSSGAAYYDQASDLQDMGNATSNADGLRLVCDGTPIDTVIYSDDAGNSDGWVDDSGELATSMSPVPESDASASRIADGIDTDASGDDFALTTPTPGAANPVIVCDPGNSDLKINEFLYDPEGSDTDLEWVEIYNAGASTAILDGYSIETATSSWSADHTFEPGTELAAGAWLVVGGPSVSVVDLVSDSFSLGNGTSGDGLRLVDCEGVVMDTVLYGDEMEDGLEGDGGETDVVPAVKSAWSLGRYPDGEDTNAIEDWSPYALPTPGTANADPGVAGTADPPGGCGSDRPARPGGGGCATVLPLGGWELALGILALRRRRAGVSR